MPDTTAQLETLEAEAVAALDAFCRSATHESRVRTTQAIDAYVDTMRDANFPPEQVVISVKEVVRRSGVRRLNLTERTALRGEGLATDQFVSAAIRRFFQTRPSP